MEVRWRLVEGEGDWDAGRLGCPGDWGVGERLAAVGDAVLGSDDVSSCGLSALDAPSSPPLVGGMVSATLVDCASA